MVGAEHPLQPLPRPRGQGVAAAQQQHPVGRGRVVLAAPTTAMGAGQALPDGGDHVVPELDQVELVVRDRGARQPGPQRLAERGRGIDRDDLDPLPPLLRECCASQSPTALESRPSTMPRTCPVARSTSVVIHGSNRIQAPSSVRNQRTDLVAGADRPPERVTRTSSTSGRTTAAALRAAWTSHHETPWARATSEAARPERITAETTWSRSRVVERAYRGICWVGSWRTCPRAGCQTEPAPLGPHHHRCASGRERPGPAVTGGNGPSSPARSRTDSPAGRSRRSPPAGPRRAGRRHR